MLLLMHTIGITDAFGREIAKDAPIRNTFLIRFLIGCLILLALYVSPSFDVATTRTIVFFSLELDANVFTVQASTAVSA